MDDKEKNNYKDDIDNIIDSRIKYINSTYLLIRNAYMNGYDNPELDPLRNEICLCLMFGLCQGAIH